MGFSRPTVATRIGQAALLGPSHLSLAKRFPNNISWTLHVSIAKSSTEEHWLERRRLPLPVSLLSLEPCSPHTLSESTSFAGWPSSRISSIGLKFKLDFEGTDDTRVMGERRLNPSVKAVGGRTLRDETQPLGWGPFLLPVVMMRW